MFYGNYEEVSYANVLHANHVLRWSATVVSVCHIVICFRQKTGSIQFQLSVCLDRVWTTQCCVCMDAVNTSISTIIWACLSRVIVYMTSTPGRSDDITTPRPKPANAIEASIWRVSYLSMQVRFVLFVWSCVLPNLKTVSWRSDQIEWRGTDQRLWLIFCNWNTNIRMLELSLETRK